MTDSIASELPSHLFNRVDESPDEAFYAQPRFVTHIDDATIQAFTHYLTEVLTEGQDILDLMSSWISHLPSDMQYSRVSGLGMNEEELANNPQLTDHIVHNLNQEPKLPYAEDTFDWCNIVVSIQYLTQPVAVFVDILRCLKPQGTLCVAMSHRLFPTKAIAAFQHLGPQDRIRLVGSYMQLSGFEEIQFLDRSPDNADPLWLVIGKKPQLV